MATKAGSWKQKSVYDIVAPEDFNSVALGTTLCNESKNLIGRRIEISGNDLSGERRNQHLRIVFEITRVEDNKAYTAFRRFSSDLGYLHSKVRKGSSKIDYMGKTKLKNSEVKIKVMTITFQPIQTSHKKIIVKRISKILGKHRNNNPREFIQASLFGKLGAEIYHEIKNICPIRRVEIEKVEIL